VAQALLALAHLVGLGLALGAATVKLTLLLRCRGDPGLVPAYAKVVRPITRLIVLGLALLTVSGIGWLIRGFSMTPLLALKIALVAAIWVIGPIIDKVAEPAFHALAPSPGAPASAQFLAARNRYLALEMTATGLFFVITVIWVVF
jgi:hypothetical protein